MSVSEDDFDNDWESEAEEVKEVSEKGKSLWREIEKMKELRDLKKILGDDYYADMLD